MWDTFSHMTVHLLIPNILILSRTKILSLKSTAKIKHYKYNIFSKAQARFLILDLLEGWKPLISLNNWQLEMA